MAAYGPESTYIYKNDEERAIIKAILERDFFSFAVYFFSVLRGEVFKVNWHHHWICQIMQEIYEQKRGNTIINISPGATKTMLVSVLFPAWTYAKSGHCRYILTSYSDDLVEGCSQDIKSIISSKQFINLFGAYDFKLDNNKKAEWTLTKNGVDCGEFLAASIRGKITGKRAGYMESGYTGAIIMDDILKPGDSDFDSIRKRTNELIYKTLRNRKANPSVPMLLIQQRVCEEDPTGFLMKNCVEDGWELIVIPAEIDQEYFENMPENIQEIAKPYLSRALKKDGVASYWEFKEPYSDLQISKRIDASTYMAQYMQRPNIVGGNLIKTQWFRKFEQMPIKFDSFAIFADTAIGTKKHNDNSVFLLVGYSSGNLYLLDLIKGKFEMPQLIKAATDFTFSRMQMYNSAPFKGLFIEFKASGPGLIQTLRQETRLPILDMNPKGDKVMRVQQAIPYIESGRIYIPENSVWVPEFLEECAKFSQDGRHKHDDQVDTMAYAIDTYYIAVREAKVANIYF